MKFFDVLLPMGRTNNALPQSPCDQEQALRLMDRYDVAEAFVFSTTARDSDPELGNAVLAEVTHPRLHRAWAYDPACVIAERPAGFLQRCLANDVRAVVLNPLMRGLRIDRSPRILALAEVLQPRRIPVLATYRQWDAGHDVIDWYELADFCRMFPRLPVIAWQMRSRANRPMFDALAETENLMVSLSSVWQAQMVEQICETFGADRIAFSMGLPYLDPGSFQAVVTYAEATGAEKEAIASGNARRIMSEANYEPSSEEQ